MGEVHAVFGQPLPQEIREDLVDMLRGLLERVESGEITAVGYAAARADGGYSTGWDGGCGTRGGLASAIMALNHRYAANLADPE